MFGAVGRVLGSSVRGVLTACQGSIICGFIISKNEVRFGKELYGFALLGNSLLLILATIVPKGDATLYLAAAACGLQNGICTMHFGAVCRTTHVTGLVTDLGTAIGRIGAILGRRWLVLRQSLDVIDKTEIEVDLARIRVYFCLIFGFGFGAAAGAWLWHFWGLWALLFPAGVTFTAGVSYMVFHSCLKEKMKVWEQERVNENLNEVETILERTRSFMQCQQGENPNFEHLDGAMSHMIDVMHDVEASIEQLYQRREVHGDSALSAESTPRRSSSHWSVQSAKGSTRASPYTSSRV